MSTSRSSATYPTAADQVLGRQAGRKNRTGGGYSYLHNAVDDHSRLAYSEILADEKKETAAGFWTRAQKFFGQAGSPSSAS
jgi:hypothetical protein